MELDIISHLIRESGNSTLSNNIQNFQKSKLVQSEFGQTSDDFLRFVSEQKFKGFVDFETLPACVLKAKRKFQFGKGLIIKIRFESHSSDHKLTCIRLFCDTSLARSLLNLGSNYVLSAVLSSLLVSV